MIDDLVQALVERLDNRYFGKYRGYVHDVADPDSRGRLRAVVPRLLGESTPTGWALPAAPYAGPDQGFFAVPELGSGVWIEFEEGDLSRPIWTGQWWGSPGAADVGTPDGTARVPMPAGVPETPRHDHPPESPDPKVRILKSATGHHIVLDDRPEHERIEIHDSRGNRIILSRDGLDRIMSNERALNKGSRSAQIDADDRLNVSGTQTETVGGAHTRTVGGSASVTVGGDLTETVGTTAWTRTIDKDGTNIAVGGGLIETVEGAHTRTVGGAAHETVVGGYGLGSGGPISLTAAGPVKIAAGLPDLTLNAFSVDALGGNVSINTRAGFLQLGGLTATSPMVLGDGLAIHLTLLAQVLKAVNPLTVAAYGPALDAWASLTPVLDLSYFGFVKRFPLG
jgi:hypothetical protein